jgi:hypothetical protein
MVETKPEKAHSPHLDPVMRFVPPPPPPQSYALVTARIPIIKLTDPATGISADLSVQNEMPVYRSMLLYEYTRIDDR